MELMPIVNIFGMLMFEHLPFCVDLSSISGFVVLFTSNIHLLRDALGLRGLARGARPPNATLRVLGTRPRVVPHLRTGEACKPPGRFAKCFGVLTMLSICISLTALCSRGMRGSAGGRERS